MNDSRPKPRAEADENVSIPKGDNFRKARIEYEGPCVEARIRGEMVTALVDTGAAKSFISKELVDLLEMWDHVRSLPTPQAQRTSSQMLVW